MPVPHALHYDLCVVMLSLSLTKADHQRLLLLAGKQLVREQVGISGLELRRLMFRHSPAVGVPLPDTLA